MFWIIVLHEPMGRNTGNLFFRNGKEFAGEFHNVAVYPSYPWKYKCLLALPLLIPVHTCTLTGCIYEALDRFLTFFPTNKIYSEYLSNWIVESSLQIKVSKLSWRSAHAHSNIFWLFMFWLVENMVSLYKPIPMSSCSEGLLSLAHKFLLQPVWNEAE